MNKKKNPGGSRSSARRHGLAELGSGIIDVPFNKKILMLNFVRGDR